MSSKPINYEDLFVALIKEGVAMLSTGFCDYCLLKDGLCTHFKEQMKNSLKNTAIDGSKFCILMIAAAKIEDTARAEVGNKDERVP